MKMMTAEDVAELKDLRDAVTYLATAVERLDREVHTLKGLPLPAPVTAGGWCRPAR
jgi:hypothetical protein